MVGIRRLVIFTFAFAIRTSNGLPATCRLFLSWSMRLVCLLFIVRWACRIRLLLVVVLVGRACLMVTLIVLVLVIIFGLSKVVIFRLIRRFAISLMSIRVPLLTLIMLLIRSIRWVRVILILFIMVSYVIRRLLLSGILKFSISVCRLSFGQCVAR